MIDYFDISRIDFLRIHVLVNFPLLQRHVRYAR